MQSSSFCRAFFAVLLFLGYAPAGAQTISCSLDPGRHKAYIAQQIEIVLRGEREASVSDAIIESTGRRAVVGEADASGSDRLRIFWVVSEVKKDPKEGRQGPIKLSMRLSIDLPGGAARLAAQDLLNRKYSYSADGRCSIRG